MQHDGFMSSSLLLHVSDNVFFESEVLGSVLLFFDVSIFEIFII